MNTKEYGYDELFEWLTNPRKFAEAFLEIIRSRKVRFEDMLLRSTHAFRLEHAIQVPPQEDSLEDAFEELYFKFKDHVLISSESASSEIIDFLGNLQMSDFKTYSYIVQGVFFVDFYCDNEEATLVHFTVRKKVVEEKKMGFKEKLNPENIGDALEEAGVMMLFIKKVMGLGTVFQKARDAATTHLFRSN